MKHQRPIHELVAERMRIATEVAEANARLATVDAEISTRLTAAMDAFGIGAPVEQLVPNFARPAVVPRVLNPVSPARKHGSVGEAIQDGVMRQLAGGSKTTRELLEGLHEFGVMVPGNNPLNNLSAHLSRLPKIVRGGTGWMLKEEKQEPPEGGS